MKISALILLCCLTIEAQPFRSINGKTYDFANCYHQADPPLTARHYISGTIIEWSKAGALITRDLGAEKVYLPIGPSRYSDSSGLLQTMMAHKMAARAPIKAGQYWAMSPVMRMRFAETSISHTETILLYNSPVTNALFPIQAFALPIARVKYLRPAGYIEVLRYDYGSVTNSATNAIQVTVTNLLYPKLPKR